MYFTTQMHLAHLLEEMGKNQRELEIFRQNLTEHPEFDPVICFQQITQNNIIKISDLRQFLIRNIVRASRDEVTLLIKEYQGDFQDAISMTEFLDLILPLTGTGLRHISSSKDKNLHSLEKLLARLIQQEIRNVTQVQLLKEKLLGDSDFTIEACFNAIDNGIHGFIDYELLCQFFESLKIELFQEDVLFILRRFNKQENGCISLEEFSNGLMGQKLQKKSAMKNSMNRSMSHSASSKKVNFNSNTKTPTRSKSRSMRKSINENNQSKQTSFRQFDKVQNLQQKFDNEQVENKTNSNLESSDCKLNEREQIENDLQQLETLHQSLTKRSYQTKQQLSPQKSQLNELNDNIEYLKSEIQKEQQELQAQQQNLSNKFYTEYCENSHQIKQDEKRKIYSEKLENSVKQLLSSGKKQSHESGISDFSDKKQSNAADKKQLKQLIATIFKSQLDILLLVEDVKNELVLRSDFNLNDAFLFFDLRNNNKIAEFDFINVMKKLNIDYNLSQVQRIIKRFDTLDKGFLQFGTFSSIFIPHNPQYQEVLNQRDLDRKPAYDNVRFSLKTENLIRDLLVKLIATEQLNEKLRSKFNESCYSIREVFQLIDKNNKKYLNIDDFKELFYDHSSFYSVKELLILFDRYDKIKSGKITVQEFAQELQFEN